LQALGCNAIGLTGADTNMILAAKRPVQDVDYGFAGDVAGPESINTPVLNILLQVGITPVFAPLTHDGKGSMLNTNADTIASVLAIALSATHEVKLMYCFEKKGVLADATNDDAVISHINYDKYQKLKKEGIVTAGMVPKLDNAFAALQKGVQQVLIGEAASVLSMQGKNAYQGTTISLS